MYNSKVFIFKLQKQTVLLQLIFNKLFSFWSSFCIILASVKYAKWLSSDEPWFYFQCCSYHSSLSKPNCNTLQNKYRNISTILSCICHVGTTFNPEGIDWLQISKWCSMSWIAFFAVCSSPKPLLCSSVHFLMSPWLICRFDLKQCLMAWLTHSGAKYWVDLPLDIWTISPSNLLWVMPYPLANLFIRLWNSFLPKTNLQGGVE